MNNMSEAPTFSGFWLKIRTAGLLLAWLAMLGWAQVRGKIEGHVTDAAGNALDKVAVVILSQRTSAKIELSTGKEGQFIQIGLEPGFYQVTCTNTGFVSRSVEIKVNIDETSK